MWRKMVKTSIRSWKGKVDRELNSSISLENKSNRVKKYLEDHPSNWPISNSNIQKDNRVLLFHHFKQLEIRKSTQDALVRYR